jgi:hypothetical protein
MKILLTSECCDALEKQFADLEVVDFLTDEPVGMPMPFSRIVECSEEEAAAFVETAKIHFPRFAQELRIAIGSPVDRAR